MFFPETQMFDFRSDICNIRKRIGIEIFDPYIFKDDFVKECDLYPIDVKVCIYLFWQVGCSFSGQEILDRLALNGQVKNRQWQNEYSERNQDYFPAFFDNFAFWQKYTKSAQIFWEQLKPYRQWQILLKERFLFWG